MKSLAKANLQLAQSHDRPRTSLLGNLLAVHRTKPALAPSKPTTTAAAEEASTEDEEEEPLSGLDRRRRRPPLLADEVNTCLYDNCGLKR